MDNLDKLKTQYLTELNVHYRDLINFLQSLPVNQLFKANAFLNLDQGIMWVQKGIELVTVQTEAPAEATTLTEAIAQEEALTIDECTPLKKHLAN